MPIFDEAILEPLARRIRFLKGFQYIPMSVPMRIVDLGCGPQILFYFFAKENGVIIQRYTGIDPLVPKHIAQDFRTSKIQIINKPLHKKIPLKDNSADIVTAFAFFEHIDHPQHILSEAYRILKPGGKIILTVPSKRAKSVLEFLSFKLHLISQREIQEHKQYYDHYRLMEILPTTVSRSQTQHQSFEWGLNNLFIITK